MSGPLLSGVVAAVVACSCDRAHRPNTRDPRAANQTPASPSSVSRAVDPKRERPPDPWPGPKGWYTFLEAESLDFGGKGFRPVEPPKSDKTVASGGKILEYLGGKATATGTVEVPKDGKYLLAIRVGAPLENHPVLHMLDVVVEAEKRVEVEWPLPHHSAKDLELHWSSYQWVTTTVDLKAGRSTVSLRAPGGVLAEESQRLVDCIVLTEDLSYEPNDRDFAPQLYARFTMRDVPSPVALAHPVTNGRVRRGPFTEPLKNGETSPWFNITREFAGGRADVYLLATARRVEHADYDVQFGTAPTEQGVFKTVNHRGPGGDVRIVIPNDSSDATPPMADFELARQRAELASTLPKVSFGKRPTRFPILTTLDVPDSARLDELKVMAYTGLNGRTGLLDDVDLANGMVFSRLYNVAGHTEHGHLVLNEAATRMDLEGDAKAVLASPNANRVQHLKLLDEAHPWPLSKFATDELSDPTFRSWLARNHFDPLSPDERRRLGPSGVEKAVRVVSDPSYEFPGVYYYSQRFRAWTIVDCFARITKLAHEIYPPGTRTTQNFGDGAVLNANLYDEGNDYFDYFKSGALDVALSEDWTDAGSTRELGAWNVALLRAATREKGQPIHMYLIASSTRRPIEVEIKAVEELTEGVKLFEVYDYTPKYKAGGGWAETPIVWPALAELTREIGAAEDVLVGAMPRHADTAIYYSIPSDIWTAGIDESAGLERMFTYVALRHAQIPVDVVSDDQARHGALSGYKVLYLPSVQVENADARVIADWVNAGGTLVLGPGAASRDVWNRSSRALDEALHLPRREAEVLEALPRGSSGYCMTVKAQGTVDLLATDALGVRWPASQIDAVAARQSFTPSPDAAVLAKFASTGAPAALSIRRGRGAVVLVGFFPGIDYGCGAYREWQARDGGEQVSPARILAETLSVLDPAHPKPESTHMTRKEENGVLPFRYSPDLRAFLTAPAMAAHVARPVVPSVPQVVTGFLEGKEGWAVPLANVTGAPLEKVDIDVSPGRAVGSVFSSRLGKLAPSARGGTDFRVSLPLESTDILYGTWN